MPVSIVENKEVEMAVVCDICNKKTVVGNKDLPEGFLAFTEYGERLAEKYELYRGLILFHEKCFNGLPGWMKEHIDILIRANVNFRNILKEFTDDKVYLLLADIEDLSSCRVDILDTVEQAINEAENSMSLGEDGYDEGYLIKDGKSHYISIDEKISIDGLENINTGKDTRFCPSCKTVLDKDESFPVPIFRCNGCHTNWELYETRDA